MKVWVIIPAYNEETNIGKLLYALKDKQLSSIVIDDGSSDNTSMVADGIADIVLKNKNNLGKGLALKKGIVHLLSNKEFDYIITMDADNQHSPSDLDVFLREAGQNEAFVVGNRMNNPQGMPLARILTNKAMSWIISKIVGQKIPDTQCGFRLIKKSVLEKIDIKTDKFEIDSEIIIKAARNNFTIKSIPVKSIYFKNHTSRINPFFDTLRFIRFITTLNK